MVVLSMQSISGNNDGTYTLYMFPFMPLALGLACRPCSGPWQLKFGDHWFIVKISGVWGVARLHLRHHHIFFHQNFCALLEWEMSWGTKVMLRAFPESARNTLNLSLQRDTEFIVSGGWISRILEVEGLAGNDGLESIVEPLPEGLDKAAQSEQTVISLLAPARDTAWLKRKRHANSDLRRSDY